MSWGACEGEIRPATAGAPKPCQSPLWAEGFGGPGDQGG